MTGTRAANVHFVVKVDGVDLGSFTKLEGLSAQFKVEEYWEGGENGFVHHLPGALNFSNLKLTRPINETTPSLGKWFTKGKYNLTRQTASVEAYDTADEGRRIARWELAGVVPVKWSGPTLSVDGSAVLLETFELAFDEITG